MPSLKKCRLGLHAYNPKKYSSCPHCAKLAEKDSVKAATADGSLSPDDPIERLYMDMDEDKGGEGTSQDSIPGEPAPIRVHPVPDPVEETGDGSYREPTGPEDHSQPRYRLIAMLVAASLLVLACLAVYLLLPTLRELLADDPVTVQPPVNTQEVPVHLPDTPPAPDTSHVPDTTPVADPQPVPETPPAPENPVVPQPVPDNTPETDPQADLPLPTPLVSMGSFSIEQREVSVAQAAAYLSEGYVPSPGFTPDMPAVNLSYEQALEYAERTGRRLCTTEEWLAALGPNVDFLAANVGGNVADLPWPVNDDREVNALGLHNMAGNVSEWVSIPSGQAAFLGAYWYYAEDMAVAVKKPHVLTSSRTSHYYIGLRCCSDQ